MDKLTNIKVCLMINLYLFIPTIIAILSSLDVIQNMHSSMKDWLVSK